MLSIALLLLAVTGYNLVLALLILRRTRVGQPGRLYASHIFTIAVWTACTALIYWPGASHDLVLFFARATFCAVTGIGITWIWFCADFPAMSLTFRRVAVAITAIGLPWFFLAWTPWVVVNTTGLPWPTHVTTGWLLPGYGLWALACALLGSLHLLKKLRRSRGLARQQIRYILIGLAGMCSIGIAVDILIPALTGSTEYAQYGALASLLLTSTATYAIIRYRLMDLRLALRTGVTYSLTLGILSGLLALLFTTLHQLLTGYIPFPLRLCYPFTVMVIALVYNPVRHWVQRLLDRLFFKSVYDYRETLREASQAFASARETQPLIDSLLQTILHTLQPRGVAIYLPNQAGLLTRVACSSPWPVLPRQLPEPDHLLAHALSHDDAIITGELLGNPDAGRQVGERLQAWEVEIALPLVAGKQLCALVFLTEKRSGDLYSRDDISLLHILSKQAAIALDNAHHYETLRRMNTELEVRVHERTLQLAQANRQLEEAITALEAERAYLSGAIDILPIPIFFRSPVHGEIRKNRAYTELLQACQLDESVSLCLLDADTHAPLSPAQHPADRALHGEVISGSEKIITMPDGSEIPILTHAGPIYLGQELVAAVVAFQDIRALKAADRAKDEFLAVLSHELKTPLTCILAWAEVARHGSDLPLIEKSLAIIMDNALRQRHLLNDLLDVSRIVHNKLLLCPEPADLWRMTEECARNLAQSAVARGVQVHCIAPTHALPVLADRVRFPQVLNNLMNNALKFTEAGGRITLTGRCDGAWAILEISDTGRGIPLERQHEIFIPCRQVERIEPSGGLGLGLTLVKGITELHQGTVTVRSAGPGQGSTFTVSLPLAPVAERPREAALGVSVPR
ncbi:MAG TPA: ATP-binding protein [Armatimonadota bacterium]|jgi:signal transduction histidine kinase